MKKFLQEVFTYFWIPLIMGLVSYIFFQMHDIILGIATLVALSAVYTLVRLYYTHKKWWLLIILLVVVVAAIGFFVTRTPDTTLAINGQKVTGTSLSLNEGSVTVSAAPDASGKYSKHAILTLTANPASGYDWKSWSGTADDAANPTTVTMSSDKRVTANFVPRCSLIINNQLVIGSFVSFTDGSVSVSPAPAGDGKYASGTEVTLTASPNSGYDWKGWSGTASDTANPTKIITSGSNKNVTVTFQPRFALTISNQLVIGSTVTFNEGSVTVNPAPGDDGKYAYGTKVTLTASPELGYGWKSWSGTAGDASNPTTVTISSDKHVAVTFEPRFLLTVNHQAVTGASTNFTEGSVSVNPAPGTDGRYARNASVTITATPAEGYRFDHWSGDASGSTTTITITMDANKTITANFVKVYTLAVTPSPTEGGSVSPASGTYDAGASVTITAAPAEGYRFDHWSGDASGSTATITITMDAAKSITAVFVRVYTLTVTPSPTEGGSVSPATGTYDAGSSVTITAAPADGYRFDHWSGDASGTTATITVTMDANKSITAVFVKVYTLTVTPSPTEGGSVSPSTGTYDAGASVTITAAPAAGYRFDHWSGDASGTTATISVTMDAAKTITAVFVKLE